MYACKGPLKHPLGNESMEMDVGVQCRPESLDGGDGTTHTTSNPPLPCATALQAEHCTYEHRQRCAAETMIPGQGVV